MNLDIHTSAWSIILTAVFLGHIPNPLQAFELSENSFQDIQVLPQGSPLDPQDQDNKSFQALPLDPAVYYGQLQNRNRNKRPKKKNHRKNTESLSGSFSGGGTREKGNTLKYAFLQPQTPPDGGPVETCKPPSSVSAFTFMNFALSAITIAANLVSNANSNNRNNNNNNNDNNDNGNDFNINSNNNAANNNNAITIPAGKKKKRSIRTRTPGSYSDKRASVLKSALRNQHQFLYSLNLDSEQHRSALRNLTSLLLKSLHSEECFLLTNREIDTQTDRLQK